MSADDGLVFIDTNVLLYAYDATAGDRHGRAAELVGSLAQRRLAATSIQVLQEFYVNATRKIAQPLSHASAVERVRAFARWPTHRPTSHDVVAAAGIADDARVSFWDAMIIRSATSLGCAVMYSEDLKAGQRVGDVTIHDPFAERT
jgi:predicted nucleic acid-binding protein